MMKRKPTPNSTLKHIGFSPSHYHIMILLVAVLACLTLVSSGCKKEIPVPMVKTLDPWQIESGSVMCGGEVIDHFGVLVHATGLCWSTKGVPDINGSHIVLGSGTAPFAARITDLDPNTQYFVRAFASNKSGTGYGNTMVVQTQMIKDVDGNEYQTVRIGDQVWMKENLKVSKLNDSTPLIAGSAILQPGIKPGYVYYNHDSTTFHEVYGKLYNWYAVETGMLCPTGWRVPNNYDWDDLIGFIGDGYMAGGPLKATDTLYWLHPNKDATDEWGFHALPGGLYVAEQNLFSEMRQAGYFWSADPYVVNNAWCHQMYFNSAANTRLFNLRPRGLSVRCIKE
jgi:uncharacterized protein (TIGR02145 family)